MPICSHTVNFRAAPPDVVKSSPLPFVAGEYTMSAPLLSVGSASRNCSSLATSVVTLPYATCWWYPPPSLCAAPDQLLLSKLSAVSAVNLPCFALKFRRTSQPTRMPVSKEGSGKGTFVLPADPKGFQDSRYWEKLYTTRKGSFEW